MKPDDELCLCFHVSLRKVEQYLRTRRPAVASQLSECYGAGTGCGWCRPFLRRLHQQIVVGTSTRGDEEADGDDQPVGLVPARLPDAESYAAERESFRAAASGDAKASDEPPDDLTPPASSGGGAQARFPEGE
ncbi:MAG: (2Fe-2S)-binding protein [Planctomycetaceae bacterium]|nr:MAG: (2Fe-2S)-binding protein [Planctomycetaceae bacterium]